MVGDKHKSKSVGIGLSTANSLAQALSGGLEFDVNIEQQTFAALLRVKADLQPG